MSIVFSEHESTNVFTEAEIQDPCRQFEVFESKDFKCNLDSFSQNKTRKCDKYVYDKSQMFETLTTKLDLVCEKEYLRRLLSTFLMCGMYVYMKDNLPSVRTKAH